MGRGLNKTFPEDDTLMFSRRIKRYSTSVIIKEMHVRTTKYHLTAIRMATIKEKNKYRWGCKEMRILVQYWWDYKMVQPLCKIVGRFFEKVQMELPYDLAIPVLDVYPKELRVGHLHTSAQHILTFLFIHNSQEIEATQRFMDRLILIGL